MQQKRQLQWCSFCDGGVSVLLDSLLAWLGSRETSLAEAIEGRVVMHRLIHVLGLCVKQLHVSCVRGKETD